MEHEVLELEEVQRVAAAPAAPTAPATTDNSPASRMLQALERGATLEQIEKMMELQERWERREAEKAFREAFAAFRGENIVIPKSKHVDRGKAGSFMQAEYDQVCSRLSPALSRHGFGFRHDQKFGLKQVEGTEGAQPWVWVTCFLEHRAGHSAQLDLEGPPGDLSANTAVQNMQVTASYLKRQSLLAITGTATGGEDDEGAMRRPDNSAADQRINDLLLHGREVAMEGMAQLLKWWGSITNEQRAALSKDYPSMRKAAEMADRDA